MTEISLFERRYLSGKTIYIFETHTVALAAWAEIRASLPEPPLLFTLDFHTDTRPAFNHYAHVRAGTDDESRRRITEERLGQIDINVSETLRHAIDELRNDEHIRTAIDLSILNAVFVLSFETQTTLSLEQQSVPPFETPPRPYTYAVPRNRIFYLPNICFAGCPARPHTDECTRPHADQAIEASHLRDKLEHCGEMIRALNFDTLFNSRYILDIDLDYFRTENSLTPQDTTLFYTLIKNAVAITIAKEPQFVRFERLDESVTSERSFEALWTHLITALQ